MTGVWYVVYRLREHACHDWSVLEAVAPGVGQPLLLPTLKDVRAVDVMQALLAPGFVYAADNGSWLGPSMSEAMMDVVPYVLFSPVPRSVFSRKSLVTDGLWGWPDMYMPWFLQLLGPCWRWDPNGDPNDRTMSGCIGTVYMWWTWEPDVWVMSTQCWQA